MEKIDQILKALTSAKALVIAAGAGMGVDSGLPDFRGDHGFWKAYPMYERLGLSFVEAANPVHFSRDPEFGWGFYGHRLNLYRETIPHEGFRILQGWIERFGLEHFVITSNVDGQFQKAGFAEDRILEVHGSIHHLQCVGPCSDEIWSNDLTIEVDFETMRALSVPRCQCGRVARPNILMFGDYTWNGHRSDEQEGRFRRFLQERRGEKLVVVEIGAGTAVPTIRYMTENLLERHAHAAVRINPREPRILKPGIPFPYGGLEGLRLIDEALS